jgi:UDPglucose 6-dehydrogenase
MTEWQAFRAPDFELIAERLSSPVIFDGRNLYDPARMARKGIAYYAIGRGLAEPPAAEGRRAAAASSAA